MPKLGGGGGGGGGGGLGRNSTRIGPSWHDSQGKRVYATEKNRVPAWCDRVLLGLGLAQGLAYPQA